MASSIGFHESPTDLSPATKDLHRALTSIQEELEAVDWYRQRADACKDNELREILLHNMREEIEHASMLLEWVRRREPDFDTRFRGYLFTQQPILAVEEAIDKGQKPAASTQGSGTGFTVGDLKGE